MMKSLRNVSLFVFAFVILFHLINNLIWFHKDGYAVHGCHSVWHEKLSIDLYQSLFDEETPFYKRILRPFEYFKISRYGYSFSITSYSLTNFFLIFPYLVPLSGQTKLLLICLLNYFHLIGVLFAMIWLGTILFNRTIGLWSAIILSFYPGIIGLSRKVNVALVTTLCVIMFIIFLMKWKTFKRIAWAFLMAVLFCLGALSSPLYFAFSLPLLFFHVIYAIYADKRKARRTLALVLFILICSLFFYWYSGGSYTKVVFNFKDNMTEAYDKFTFKSDSFIGSAKEGLVESFLFAPQDSVCPCTQTTNVGCNLKTFLFYIMQCIKYTSPLFFILGILSFLMLMKNKNIPWYTKNILTFWIIGGYVILSIFHIKWGKFCAPMLPVLALSNAYVINEWKRWRNINKFILTTIGIGVILYYSYIPYPRIHSLEKLTEGLVSHRPLPTVFVPTAQKTANTIINTMPDIKGRLKIAFVDKDSLRFEGEWVTDMSLRVGLLVSTFISRPYTMEYFWSLDEYKMEYFNGYHFFVVLSHIKVKDMHKYLFLNDEKSRKQRLLIFSENVLNESTFLYVVRIQVLD